MSGVPARRAFQPSLLILLVASLLLVVVAARASVTPTAPAPPPRAALPAVALEAAGDQDYVGTAVCADCHADEAKSYQGGAHARVADLRAPAAVHGCESCHGPGRAHADDPADPALMVSPRTLDATPLNATCTTCHTSQALHLWDGSSHESRGLSCLSCHTIHAAASAPLLTRASESATCASCHQAEVSRTNRSAHTSAHAASMTCSSCHNAHGTVADGLLRVGQTGNDTCVSCHAGMRGPFLWEHAPVRESCVSCHEPHGSSVPGMLIARQPLLCQQCHTTAGHASLFYDGAAIDARSNRIIGRSCTTCHPAVHGSNHPAGAGLMR